MFKYYWTITTMSIITCTSDLRRTASEKIRVQLWDEMDQERSAAKGCGRPKRRKRKVDSNNNQNRNNKKRECQQ